MTQLQYVSTFHPESLAAHQQNPSTGRDHGHVSYLKFMLLVRFN
jgi:hypothetical protein